MNEKNIIRYIRSIAILSILVGIVIGLFICSFIMKDFEFIIGATCLLIVGSILFYFHIKDQKYIMLKELNDELETLLRKKYKSKDLTIKRAHLSFKEKSSAVVYHNKCKLGDKHKLVKIPKKYSNWIESCIRAKLAETIIDNIELVNIKYSIFYDAFNDEYDFYIDLDIPEYENTIGVGRNNPN